MSTRTRPRSARDSLQVAAPATAVSLLALLYCYSHGEILLYGDAIAHINIARRVFDSQTPGLMQLGNPWLPLPHLAMIPFLLNDWLWRTGIGGSAPSMIAYVLGVVGIFRLVRGVLEEDARTQAMARLGAWVAAFVYAANPNLIYVQATALTEPLYLACFIWAVVYFAEFARRLRQGVVEGRNSALFRCGLCLSAAELTRYDGWFLAATMGVTVIVLAFRHWDNRSFRLAAIAFLVIISLAPLMWVAYNVAISGNPLEFINGPYSAKGIEQRSPGSHTHPGAHNLAVAASYFLMCGGLNMASGTWGLVWIAVALAGLVLVRQQIRERWALLLLWVPLLFYALSIAYSGVPIFMPVWNPHSWYNLRYGLQLVPLIAVSVGMLVAVSLGSGYRYGRQATAALLALTVISYALVWRDRPQCFKEAWVNSRTKLALESAVAESVRMLPAGAAYLMCVGDHVGIFQQLGVPFRRVVYEGNQSPGKFPGPEGLWEKTLADPPRYVNYVIAFEGDPVDQAVDKTHLTLLTEIHTTGQPAARIYAVQPDGRGRPYLQETVLNQSR